MSRACIRMLIFLFCLSLGWCCRAAGLTFASSGKEEGVKISVTVSGLGEGGEYLEEPIHVGRELNCTITISNVSGKIIAIPDPEKCLSVKLTAVEDNNRYFIVRKGVVDPVIAILLPEQEIVFNKKVTPLRGGFFSLRVSFENQNREREWKKAIVEGGHQGNGGGNSAIRAKEEIKDVWTGSIRIFRKFEIRDALCFSLSKRYREIYPFLRVSQASPEAITDYRQSANDIPVLENDGVNETHQSRTLELIYSVGQDSNEHSVDWLWRAFWIGQKNSQVRMTAMAELYRLLTLGVGSGHLQDFITVALSDPLEVAVLSRVYAMDALSLYCTRSRFWCTLKGNCFFTSVSPEAASAARNALLQLSEDHLKDVRRKAQVLLGTYLPQEEDKGRRKYIRRKGGANPSDEVLWDYVDDVDKPKNAVPPKERKKEEDLFKDWQH